MPSLEFCNGCHGPQASRRQKRSPPKTRVLRPALINESAHGGVNDMEFIAGWNRFCHPKISKKMLPARYDSQSSPFGSNCLPRLGVPSKNFHIFPILSSSRHEKTVKSWKDVGFLHFYELVLHDY